MSSINKAMANPLVSVTLPRSEWLFLETWLVVHEAAFERMGDGPCAHMRLRDVRKRLVEIKTAVIKAERSAVLGEDAA